ncbi:MAG: MoaD/ThiS family protein [Ignavibacteriales bacterium]|nr:MoaD/ThiS family protein [Ignavibacteriales bacterium]
MAVKIFIPTPLRPYVDKQDFVQVEGETVGELLERLTEKYSVLRKHLFAEDGKLRSYVNVYVNDHDIRYLQNEKTGITENDAISIVPSIAGGIDCVPNAGRRRSGTEESDATA